MTVLRSLITNVVSRHVIMTGLLYRLLLGQWSVIITLCVQYCSISVLHTVKKSPDTIMWDN